MREDIRKALHKFEQATARAWMLDGEDNITDKNRASTQKAHAEADVAKAELASLLDKV